MVKEEDSQLSGCGFELRCQIMDRYYKLLDKKKQRKPNGAHQKKKIFEKMAETV